MTTILNQHTAAPSAADRAYLEGLRRGFETDYPPQTTAERVLLDELIGAAQRLWHLNRLEEDHCAGSPDLDVLGKISRQRTAAERTFHRSRTTLEKNKSQRLRELQNEPNSAPMEIGTNKANLPPVIEICKNEPDLSRSVEICKNEPKIDPADEPACRHVEQQIMAHGRAAAFREDDEETGYADDLLELYFDFKGKIPLGDLQRQVSALTGDVS